MGVHCPTVRSDIRRYPGLREQDYREDLTGLHFRPALTLKNFSQKPSIKWEVFLQKIFRRQNWKTEAYT